MGFVKVVSIACDGPCGTVLSNTEKAPAGWTKTITSIYEKLETGQKPEQKPLMMWLCPKCTQRFIKLLHQGHFNLSKQEKEGGPSG